MGISKSALKVMNILWDKGDCTAKAIVEELKQSCGWNKNTTYTVIRRCIEGGQIQRLEPNFLCHPLVSRQEVQQEEAEELVADVFQGSLPTLFSALAQSRSLKPEELHQLEQLIEQLK